MSLKRVLIAYSRRPPIIDYLKRAFGEKGVEAEGFYADDNSWFDRYVIHHVNKTAHNLRILPKSKDLFKEHRLAHLNYRSDGLMERFKEFSPELVLIIRGIRFRQDVLREIGKKAALFGWWIEKEERMNEAFKEAGLFDHYFFMNSSCVEEGRKKGLTHVSLLHHSVDPAVFRPVEAEKEYDWCFVGSWSPKRQTLIERALKVSKKGAIWGPKWLKNNLFNVSIHRAVKGAYIDGQALVDLYNSTRVVLNITNWGFGEGEKRSGMNMRVLEVPACGALLLTDGSKDLKSIVTPGAHVVLYSSPDEFASSLSHYIDNDKEREAIGLEGRRHVAGRYTYSHVANEILDRLERLDRGGGGAEPL